MQPSDEVLAHFGTAPVSSDPRTTAGSTPAARTRGGADGTLARRGEGGASGNGNGTLYTLDAKGMLQVARVRTGISDGLFTEVHGQDVTEGMKVMDGTVSASPRPAAAASNPMGGAQQSGRGRPGGGF
jgi:hypothetical protein